MAENDQVEEDSHVTSFRFPSKSLLFSTLADSNKPIAARMRSIFYLRSLGDEEEEEEEKDNNKDEQEILAREVDGPVIVQDPDAPDLEDAEHTTLDGQETNRLALVNCDWSELRAVDIFATLQSFVPKGRALFKVTVHLSDYGMKRLAEESRSGPSTMFASSSSSTSVGSTKPETVSLNEADVGSIENSG